MLTVLLVITGSVLWIAARTNSQHAEDRVTPPSASATPSASSPAARTADAPSASIAVVPFANLTGDPAKEYFGDGMAEELINTLASVPGLRVPARAGRYGEAASDIVSGMRADALAAGGRETVELVYAALGEPNKRPAALAALRRLLSNIDIRALGPTSSMLVALWYTELGDIDLAYDTVTRSLDDSMRAGIIGTQWQWCWLPELRAFRQDPRFEPLVTRLGFMEYWKQYGPPDDCELRDGKLRCH